MEVEKLRGGEEAIDTNSIDPKIFPFNFFFLMLHGYTLI